MGKHEKKINPEPRILIEKPEYSYGDDISKNMLIHGDNLLALKSLQQDFIGMVKCIYIDPPYNTGAAFEHYDDNLEHSTWLSLMKPRLELLRSLLAEDGSIWISVDDDEQAYLRVLCDEVFGRSNFIAQIVWQKRYSRENREAIGDVHEYIIVYSLSPKKFKASRNLVPMTEEQAKVYKNPNNDPKGRWRPIPLTAQAGHATSEQFYEITAPDGNIFTPPPGRCWGVSKQTYERYLDEGRIYFGKNNNSQPNYIRYLSEVPGVAPWTWWPSNEVGHNDIAKKEILKLFDKDNIFDTPKPEILIQRILHIATNEGDLVLDSFLGSGTTAAVAHKMNRRWIGIELGEHAYTHCQPRLKAVINGEQGGISNDVSWQGGGGFKFYELAPTLLEKSKRGNLVISDKYNEEMLAQAMAKHEGYIYAPDEDIFWKQGHSGDNNFIFTTTGHLTSEYIDNIASQLGEDEYLLICAESFDVACIDRHKRIIIRPIPKMLLGRCEWGRDSYDLNVIMQEVTDWEGDIFDEQD